MWQLLLVTQIFAADPTVTAKARQIFLADGRKPALAFLQKQLEQAGLRPEQKSKILTEGHNIAQKFLTDRAQRDFEMANSVRFSGGAGAKELYEKALLAEPDNTEILISMAMLDLVENKCGQAKAKFEEIKSIWKQHPMLANIQLLIRFCEKVTPSYTEVKAVNTSRQSLRSFDVILEMRALVAAGRGAEALQIGRKLKDENPTYAETYFWMFKAGQVESEGDPDLLKKYVSTCQAYTETDRREYRLDPSLCTNTAEAQQVLKTEEAPK